jgi:hypothetical protein
VYSATQQGLCCDKGFIDTTLVSLKLPSPGAYAVISKVVIANLDTGGSQNAECKLWVQSGGLPAGVFDRTLPRLSQLTPDVSGQAYVTNLGTFTTQESSSTVYLTCNSFDAVAFDAVMTVFSVGGIN